MLNYTNAKLGCPENGLKESRVSMELKKLSLWKCDQGELLTVVLLLFFALFCLPPIFVFVCLFAGLGACVCGGGG